MSLQITLIPGVSVLSATGWRQCVDTNLVHCRLIRMRHAVHEKENSYAQPH